jgi:hypothetical protein
MATKEMITAVQVRYEKMMKESATTEINKKRTESYVDWLESYVADDLLRHCRNCKFNLGCTVEPNFVGYPCEKWTFGGDK